MTAVTTAGFLIHLYLTVAVVLGGANTKNPIWGELRAVAAAVPVVAMWAVLQGAM